jgi:hypothetical protein
MTKTSLKAAIAVGTRLFFASSCLCDFAFPLMGEAWQKPRLASPAFL